MSDTDLGQLLPAHQIIERGVSRRPRLTLVQPLVGIGDMVWHKLWIDHVVREYDIILATKPTVHAQHPTAKMAEFATLNGFPPPQTNWTIVATARACDAADTFIVEAGVGKTEHMLILGLGAMHVDRQWLPTHFARLIERISARFPHLHSGLMGANAELPVIEAVITQLSDASGGVICTRPRDQSMALLERAFLYVGNHTSLLNIAATARRPAIDLFAQTLPLIYNPEIKSVALSSDQVGKSGAIKTIAPDLVFDAVCTELHHHGVVTAQVATR